jgi:hypothetical protein
MKRLPHKDDYDSDDSSEEEEDEEVMTLVPLCVHKVQFMNNLVELRLDGGIMMAIQLSIVDQTPGGLCDITPSVLEWFPFVTRYHFQYTPSETWKALMHYFIENRSSYEGNYEKGCEEPDDYMKYVYIKRICK